MSSPSEPLPAGSRDDGAPENHTGGAVILSVGLTILSIARVPLATVRFRQPMGGLGMSAAYVPCNVRVVRGSLPGEVWPLALPTLAAAFLGWLLVPRLIPLFSFTYGVFYGGFIVLMPAMAGELFGREYAGAILGALFACIGWADSLGVLGAGMGRDTLGSYDLVFGLAVAACVVGIGLFLMVRMPPSQGP